MDVVSPDHQEVFFALKSPTKSALYLTVDEANLSNCSKKTFESCRQRPIAACNDPWWFLLTPRCRRDKNVLSTVTMLHESHPPRWMQSQWAHQRGVVYRQKNFFWRYTTPPCPPSLRMSIDSTVFLGVCVCASLERETERGRERKKLRSFNLRLPARPGCAQPVLPK